MDWKEQLAQLAASQPSQQGKTLPQPSPQGETPPQPSAQGEGAKCERRQKGKLNVVVEKKGRGGKTATIVEGFELTDEEVAEIARELKKKLGVGGSSRGGEILIQGDRKADVVAFLRNAGFRV